MSMSDAVERQNVREGSTTTDECLARIRRSKASNQAVPGLRSLSENPPFIPSTTPNSGCYFVPPSLCTCSFKCIFW